MKNILRTIFPAVLLITCLSGSALAQTKVATVDMRKLFDGYWKTKQAQVAINDRKTQLDKDDKSMKDDLKKANDEYQQLLEQANDQAISGDERVRRKQAADEKLKKLQDSRAAIDQYERQAQTTLADQSQRMREKILDAIQGYITTVAKAGGYTLVIDTSSRTITLGAGSIDLPSEVVYKSGENDITDAVLKKANADAPIDLTSAPAPGSTAAPPSMTSTNKP